MNRNATRRVELFERGAEALRRVVSDPPGEHYACPICTRLCTRADAASGELTLEHVPPASQGGRPILLTCRECNSVAGHELDAEAHQREQVWEFGQAVAGERAVERQRALLDLGGERVRADARIAPAEGTIYLDIWDRINNPAVLARQQEFVEAAAAADDGADVEFQITPQISWDERRADLSDLHAAFLLGFALFGYRYALDPRLEPVRRQIRNPGESIIPQFTLASRDELAEPPAILLAEQPLPAFVVQFRRSMVVLPGLSGPREFYAELPRALTANRDTGFHGEHLVVPERLMMVLDFSS